MSHLDPDAAALIAMGEPVATEEERAHLAECPACAADVASLVRTVAVGRSATGDTALLTPPSRVWDAISAELNFDETGEPDSERDPTPEVYSESTAASETASEADKPAAGHAVRRGARSRRRLVLALVGAAAALVIVAGVWTTASFLTPRPDVIAEAALDGFPAWQGAEGEAVLEKVDGHRQVVVTLDAPVPPDGYREVWLIAADGSALVSLGVLEGSSGAFEIPDDVDLSTFTLVDISQEETGGDPGHSGDSIVRGELRPA